MIFFVGEKIHNLLRCYDFSKLILFEEVTQHKKMVGESRDKRENLSSNCKKSKDDNIGLVL